MPWENLSEDLQDLFEQSHEGNGRGDVAHLSYRERTDAKLRIINPNGAPDPTRWRRYWQILKADPERYAKYLARNAANKKKWREENRDKVRAYDRKYRTKPGRKEYMRKWSNRPDIKEKRRIEARDAARRKRALQPSPPRELKYRGREKQYQAERWQKTKQSTEALEKHRADSREYWRRKKSKAAQGQPKEAR